MARDSSSRGRSWAPYSVGQYRLGRLHGEAVAIFGKPRQRYRLGVFTEGEGRAALRSFAETAAGEARPLTVQAVWDAYITDREADGKGMAVFKSNWTSLGPAFGHLRPDEVDKSRCRDYARARFEAGRAPATVWTELVRLRTALAWAVADGQIDAMPSVWVPKGGQRREMIVTERDARSAIALATGHTRLFLILLIATGARSAALLELTWERVDFDTRIIDLRADANPDPMSKAHRKGRAVVPMNDLAREALLEAREAAASEHVIEYNGRPVASVKKSFARLMARAGLPGVSPHTFRHSVASWHDAWGTDPERIAALLGHRTSDTTRRVYIHRDPEALRSVVRRQNMRPK